jgi:ADP-heptose:LPS heptosyltransferase
MARILIIKFGALGDVIMATTLINQIRIHHADDEVWLITSTAFLELFEHWNNLGVKTFDRRGIKPMLQAVCWMRQLEFTRLYDLQSNDRTGILCALSGIAERVGNHPRYPYNIHPQEKYIGHCHIHDRMLQILAAAGINVREALPLLPSNETIKEKIKTWLDEHGLKEKQFIIIHAGASDRHPEKRWPYYDDLARVLDDRSLKVIWIGTTTDAEINARLSRITGIDATGAFSIIELAELGRHACFALTNDSGPMHILSCSGIPVYALFGPTDWRRNHAIMQQAHVITADNGTGAAFKPTPLHRISVNQVITRLRADKMI